MYNLIVVEDESRLRAGLCDFYPWSDLGFEVVGQMADGEEALAYIRENPVDVVLTDISMPRMTGIELAEVLTRDYPAIKTVFLSGFAEFGYAQQALRLKVADYILKPVKAADLTAVFSAIRSGLDSRGAPARSENYYGKLVQRVQHYARDHLDTATLEEAAGLVCLSAGYLSTLYKQETGKAFSEFLLELRMQKARELLLDVGCKTYQVAEALGYENPKNFARAFKQFHGISPRDFRKTGLDEA